MHSARHMELVEEVRHQLRESAVVLLTQGPEKMREWWGLKPLVRIVRRKIVQEVKAGRLEGPHTRYYVSAHTTSYDGVVICFILDRERIGDYHTTWKAQNGDGDLVTKRRRVSSLCSMTDSIWVGSDSDLIERVQLDQVEKIEGPGSLLDGPTLKVTF